MKIKNFLSILSLYMMDKCAKVLIEKKEIPIGFIKDLFERDDVDILYEEIRYNGGYNTKKTKGILDENRIITRDDVMETLLCGTYILLLKKFSVGRTNLTKYTITFSSSYGENKITWYEEN